MTKEPIDLTILFPWEQGVVIANPQRQLSAVTYEWLMGMEEQHEFRRPLVVSADAVEWMLPYSDSPTLVPDSQTVVSQPWPIVVKLPLKVISFGECHYAVKIGVAQVVRGGEFVDAWVIAGAAKRIAAPGRQMAKEN